MGFAKIEEGCCKTYNKNQKSLKNNDGLRLR